MTTHRQMAEMVTMQQWVIAVLRRSGDEHVADRLERCLGARVDRQSADGRPWTCRSAGCAWCGKTLFRRWWSGILHWITADGDPVSLAILPVSHGPGELRAAVARLRRACRDIRDRAARRHAPWRRVAVAGLALGQGTAWLLIRHPGVARSAIVEGLHGRWPGGTLQHASAKPPCWHMSVEDAAELGRTRRGIEPLRVVVLPQRVSERTRSGDQPPWAEPMPVVF